MNWLSETCRDAVEAALEKETLVVRRDGPYGWRCALSNGRVMPLRARLDEGWLSLTARPRHSVDGADGWTLLEVNAGLCGPVRFGLSEDGDVQLLADVMLANEAEVDGNEVSPGIRVREALSGFRRAAESLQTVSKPFGGPEVPRLWMVSKPLLDDKKSTAPDTSNEKPAASEAAKVTELCADLDWRWTERSSGEVSMELDVPGRFEQAVLGPVMSEGFDDTGVCARVALAPAAAYSDRSREAVTVFLLESASVIRVVKPVVSDESGGAMLRLEASWMTAPTTTELDGALEALSLACRVMVREVRALQDEKVAHEVLKLRQRQSH